jgi:hypothetical protein
MGHSPFQIEDYFPTTLFERITYARIHTPEVVAERASNRTRPVSWVKPGERVVILAADPPARFVTRAAGDELVMGDRYSYLGRLVRILVSQWCDGILGTPDILEDLLILDHLIIEAGGASILDGRIVVGTMNRGGLAGASFEVDDTFTAYTVDRIVATQIDAAKAMVRLDFSNPDSLKTLTACASAIDDCVDAGIPMFLEALPVEKTESGYQVTKTSEALIKTVGVASAKSSLNTWIKIPYCEDYAAVARSTTCPILMLGGESSGDPTRVFSEFSSGLSAGSNVRGALVGRNIHHPGAYDPAATAAAVYDVLHNNATPETASDTIQRERHAHLDVLTGLMN